MGLKVYVNGEFVDRENARISVFDHGLLYGDGVFEGIRAYSGKIFRLDEHINRLYEGAAYLSLEIPLSKDEMKNILREGLEINGLDDAYIRLLVTRGVGSLGLRPDQCERPGVIAITDRIALYPEELYETGLSIITAKTRSTNRDALSSNVKSLNYLNNILAKTEAINAGVLEAIMLSGDGYVSECTGDNIFIVRDGLLITPPESVGLLNGITRQLVLELAGELGIPAEEQLFLQEDIYSVDECFLTGTAAEVIGVVNVDGKQIGDGHPGPITAQLRGAFRKSVELGG